MTEPSLLGKEQKRLLTDLVDTIIPETDTPGAAGLDVQRFVERMIQDCFDASVQRQLVEGLDKVDREAKKQSGVGFSRLKPAQRLAILRDRSSGKSADEQSFLDSMKNLTIQGYLSSEYVMTNINRYELIPARYHGCVDIGS